MVSKAADKSRRTSAETFCWFEAKSRSFLDAEKSCLSGMKFTVGRLERTDGRKCLKMIIYSRMNDAF